MPEKKKNRPIKKMNIYLESFGIFFKIGAFTIGGGYAMVPLIENEIVTKRKWIAQEDFVDLLAISQSAPGILAVNISIFIGYKLRGIRGSIITALGTILPSFIIILAIALFFHNFKDNVIVSSFCTFYSAFFSHTLKRTWKIFPPIIFLTVPPCIFCRCICL